MRLTSPVGSEQHADGWPHEAQDDARPRTVMGRYTSYDAVDEETSGLHDIVEGDEEAWHNPTPNDLPDLSPHLTLPACRNSHVIRIHDNGKLAYDQSHRSCHTNIATHLETNVDVAPDGTVPPFLYVVARPYECVDRVEEVG